MSKKGKARRAYECSRFTFWLIVFLLFVAALLFDASHWIGMWDIALRLGSVAVLLLLIHRYNHTHFLKRLAVTHHETNEFVQVPDSRCRDLQQEIRQASLVTLDQVDVFTRAVIGTSKLHQRIVEEYRPDQRSMQKEVTIDVRIPTHIMRRTSAPGSGVFLYPVLVPPKGVFYDDLRVYGADGARLPVLSYREYVHIAASVLHLLLSVACDKRPEDLPENVVACEREAIGGLLHRVDTRPNPADKGRGPDGRELANLIERMPEVSSEESRRRAAKTAAHLAEVLARHYAIVVAVPVPKNGRFMIRYTCLLTPELDLAPNIKLQSAPEYLKRRMRSLKTRLNVLFSTRPVDVKVSLDNAWTCQSYHVLVRCPDGLYLSKQELVVDDGYLRRRAIAAPTPPHVRFRARLGQSYAHFYARFMPPPRRAMTDADGKVTRPGEKAPKLVLYFQETPPGSVCRAALAAIASAVLVWIIGYGLSSGHDIGNTDAPALLLAFPGVAASWMGFDGTKHRLFEGMLTARLSLAITALVSLFATGLYLLSHQGHSASAGSLTIGVLGITLWPWMVLTVVALFNASYLCYRWGLNSWRFRSLAERDEPGGLVAKVRQATERDNASPSHVRSVTAGTKGMEDSSSPPV